jgi:ribonucleoside-triphosphate reductase
MAPKLAQIDRLIFGREMVPYELYSNQFVPLWEDVDLYKRMQIDGKYNKLFTGGGIVHFNLGERILPSQAKALITYAASVGCEHFALNPVYSECEHTHITFGKTTKCPTCSSAIVNYYTRVVGFLVPVTHFNKTRREWEFPRRRFTTVE